eukprot:Sspe_Gene.89024::Locus_60893_Transcript_3_6_Confidence_0.583_Length_470::g.89024::m.89024
MSISVSTFSVTPRSADSSQSSPSITPPPSSPKTGPQEDDVLSSEPMCQHNDWDDVRTRKGSKVLRCRLCQSKWKVSASGMPRCVPFAQGRCLNGMACPSLHIHKKKPAWARTQEVEERPLELDVLSLHPETIA